jgi:hypothetical protein
MTNMTVREGRLPIRGDFANRLSSNWKKLREEVANTGVHRTSTYRIIQYPTRLFI